MAASLGLALFFWSILIIAQGEMLEKVVTVPVDFTASPANLFLVGDKDKIAGLITTPIYLDSIYGSTSIFCKIISLPALQPVEKRWPDVEVVIKISQ